MVLDLGRLFRKTVRGRGGGFIGGRVVELVCWEGCLRGLRERGLGGHSPQFAELPNRSRLILESGGLWECTFSKGLHCRAA